MRACVRACVRVRVRVRVSIPQPLHKGLAEAIESGSVSLGQGARALAQQLQTNFNWDVLAAR